MGLSKTPEPTGKKGKKVLQLKKRARNFASGSGQLSKEEKARCRLGRDGKKGAAHQKSQKNQGAKPGNGELTSDSGRQALMGSPKPGV